MKKVAIYAIVALLAAACATEQTDTIVFAKATADKEVKLSNDEGSPVCAVHLRLDYATSQNGAKADRVNNYIERRLLDMEDLTMQQAADSFASAYTSTYRKNFLPLYNQDRADTTKRSWYEYHYVITTQAQQGSKRTISYTATVDYFEGGAHGINQLLAMNFDSKTGQPIELDDIFVGGYEHKLSTILRKALSEKVGAKGLVGLHEKGYLFSMKMYPAQNFILGDETITFVYNPYEIASYDKGKTELTVALGALRDILNPTYRP